MDNYEEILNNPKFKEFLEKRGIKVRDPNILYLKNGVEIKIVWTFDSIACVYGFIKKLEIENFDPREDLMHFAILAYACSLNHFREESNILLFDDFVKLLPSNPREIGIALRSLLECFEEGNKEVEDSFRAKE